MKIDRYRDIMNHIDTDMECDNKIKDELRFCEFYEKDEHSIFSLKEKSVVKKHPILTAFQSISMVGRLITSVAFLAILLIVFVSFHIHLRSSVPTNNDLSTSPITQEPEEDKDITKNTVDATTENTAIDETKDTTIETTENVIEGETINTTIDTTIETTENLAENPVDTPEEGEDTNVITQENTENSNNEPSTVDEDKNPVEDSSKSTDANENNTTVGIDDAKAGDFYFAHFDVVADGKVKSSIPSLGIRLHGLVDSINPDNLTDIVLTRDGVPIDNAITLTNRIDQFEWGYEFITDFYFKFTTNNTEPGIYGLTGKYKGVPFEVYNKIIEAEITDVAANPSDLDQVNLMGYMDEKNNWTKFSELVFSFNGLQNSFYVSDLSELKITCNGEEIPYAFESRVFRYYEVSYDNNADTSFNLILTDEFTASGVYIITGKYQGVSFVSNEMTIP
ncbi:MAG: hypothetical protein QM644_03530 [Mobilitalea sp.]